MGVESDTYQVLSNTTALTALVGTRIYPEHRPTNDSSPSVVFFRAPGGERVNSLTGYEKLENAIIEIEVFATAVDERRQVADQVIKAMTTNSTRFSCTLPDPPYDDYDDETQTYERIMDFSIWIHTT